MRNLLTKTVKETFIGVWSVIFFVLFCFMLYEQGINTSNEKRVALSTHLARLQEEKEIALQEQTRLLMHVKSQNDSEWIELTLMKELGLCPEGQIKVMFN